MKDCRQEGSKPCATCPFVRANFGKPNPEGYDPKRAAAEHGGEFYDWYTEKNLRRIWRGGLSQGEAMICHATDPTAAEYGGKAAAPGNERPCIGALAIVLLHLKFVEGIIRANPHNKPGETRRLYRAAAGKFPMTKQGMLAWAITISIGRTNYIGGLTIPTSLSPEVIASCGVPWKDDIVDGAIQGKASAKAQASSLTD